jgi:hypothetical protein
MLCPNHYKSCIIHAHPPESGTRTINLFVGASYETPMLLLNLYMFSNKLKSSSNLLGWQIKQVEIWISLLPINKSMSRETWFVPQSECIYWLRETARASRILRTGTPSLFSSFIFREIRHHRVEFGDRNQPCLLLVAFVSKSSQSLSDNEIEIESVSKTSWKSTKLRMKNNTSQCKFLLRYFID